MLQFGHVSAGGSETYSNMLGNRFTDPTMVDLSGNSLQGWTTMVDPASLLAQPNSMNPVTTTVSAPMSPTFPLDVEMVTASASGVPSTTAYLITLVGHHGFANVPAGSWSSDYIDYLVAQGAISGYSDGTFRPYDNVTRAQFAKVLVAAMGWAIDAPQTQSFSDVSAGYWAYGYIETAVSHGVVSGYSDGTFKPGAAK